MNEQSTPRDEFDALPLELRSIDLRLEALAAAESGARAGLEDRILHGSLASLKGLGEIQARADALAAADRAAALTGVEMRVSEASTESLVGAADGAPAHRHEAVIARISGPMRRRSWSFVGRVRALAAVLLVGIGGVLTWQAVRPMVPGSIGGIPFQTDAEIKSRLDEGLDTLLSVVSDVSNHASRDADANQQTAPVDDLWDEGASG